MTRRNVCIVGLALTALLAGCAMPGRAPQPGTAAEAPGDSDGVAKKAHRPEPTTIAGWEARIQGHTATLYALNTTRSSPTKVVSPNGSPPPRRRRPRTLQSAPGPTSPATGAHSGLSLRCRRICRHVQAICYAARRICQIAKRVGGESARAACQRNQQRCTSAQTVTSKNGCGSCGQSGAHTRRRRARRACLR